MEKESSSPQKSNPKFKSRIWKRTEKKPHIKTPHKQRSHVVHFHNTSSVSNDSSLDRMSTSSHPARLYSDVVAFGNEVPTRVSHIAPARKKLSKKKSFHKKRNNFEGFPPLANTSLSEDDHVSIGCETEVDKLDLLKHLNIRVDDFNFTEVDEDPNSTSFPRFLRVFEDDDYLKLEQKILENVDSKCWVKFV